MTSDTSGIVRLSVNIRADAAAFIRYLAARRRISATEVVRRAVTVLVFFEDARRRGATVRIEEPCGCRRTLGTIDN